MSDRQEVEQVKQMLKDRIKDVARWLRPDGRAMGGHWQCNHPGDGPRQTPEMRIYFTGYVGSWKDFRSGDKGDVLQLLQLCLGTDFKGAMDHARDFLGLRAMSAAERRQVVEQAKERREKEDADARRKEAWKRKQAEKLFLSGAPLGTMTPAEVHVRDYLRLDRGGLDFDKIENLDRTTFRFLPDLEFWEMAEWGRDKATNRFVKVKEGPRLPAMICAMRDPFGRFVDLHATFLDPARPVKATLPPKPNGKPRKPRLMRLPNAGSVIRIAHGPEGKPPEQSSEPHPLVEAEGVETSLSLAAGLPECRHWSCASISGIEQAPDNFPFVAAIFVAGENDWDNEQAQRALAKALDAKEATGKPWELMTSHIGSDFNDLMKGDE